MDYFTNKSFVIWTIVILVILNLFTISAFWFTKIFSIFPVQQFMMHEIHDMNHKQRDEFLLTELNLSEEQKKKFKESREKHHKLSIVLHEEIFVLKEQLINELFSTEVDSTKIKKLSEEIGLKQTELEMQNNAHILELKSICKPEQQEKLSLLFNEMFEMFRESRQDEHIPPPPPLVYPQGLPPVPAPRK